ncbi:MAG: hypothetical protein B6I28_04190 [Fusobacteriia bacterium 4572_132]|nr:MAG: hypothetical protein B6I28_04190 [Fusobacteriia bacterium 4572_132]
MKTYLECIPCIISQGIKTAKRLNISEEIQEEMVKKTLDYLKDKNYGKTPPEIAKPVYKIINKYVGTNDPFKELKDFYNDEMMKIENDLKIIIEKNNDLKTAIKLAITGNIIDFGAKHSFDKKVVLDKIDEIEHNKLMIDNSDELYNKLKESKTLLYLGDNCGEIVFDKVFIEYLQNNFPHLNITFGVRGKPIINDVTEVDAKKVGLDKIVNIISNGDSAPGTVIEDTSDEFKKKFYESDLIIAKGQGNYEKNSRRLHRKIRIKNKKEKD